MPRITPTAKLRGTACPRDSGFDLFDTANQLQGGQHDR